jgi:hypothetical protein
MVAFVGGMSRSLEGPRHWVKVFWSTLAAILVTATCGVAIVSTGRASAVRVRLLPDPPINNGAWDWTAGCYLAPATATACASSDPNYGHVQLDGDIWNLGGGRAGPGSVGMALGTSGSLLIRGMLPTAPPCTEPTCIAPSANTWVRGYPSVVYGLDQCAIGASPPASAKFPVPMKVSSIPADLVGSTTYVAQAQRVTYDIAYDMWLNDSSTNAPCHKDGTIEIMVWTDYDTPALLPASMMAATASVPFAVNGVEQAGKSSWSVYTSNIFPAGQTAPWGGTIWFVLGQSAVQTAGTVSVDLSSVLSAAGQLLAKQYAWSNFADHYWLDTVPFGIEFGPQSAQVSATGPSYFSLDISSYCLELKATVTSHC